MKPMTKEQYDYMQQEDIDTSGFPAENKMDRQFLLHSSDSNRQALPPPQVRSHSVDGVTDQGTRVIAKGVPAEEEIIFFGFPDYDTAANNDAEADESVDKEYEYYEESEEGDDYYDESEEEDDSGMSMLDKTLLASDIAMMGGKVKGLLGGKKKDENGVD